MSYRWIQMAGVFLAVAALVVCAPALRPVAAAPDAAGPRVEIKHHKYVPAALTVPVGTTVTWINRDDDVHTVISTAEKFRSRGMNRATRTRDGLCPTGWTGADSSTAWPGPAPA